jgi:hypothetical protein
MPFTGLAFLDVYGQITFASAKLLSLSKTRMSMSCTHVGSLGNETTQGNVSKGMFTLWQNRISLISFYEQNQNTFNF